MGQNGDDRNTARPGSTLAWASLVMIGSVALSRALGMIREMVIAALRGAGGEVDAYLIAFMVPDWINHLAAGGFLSVTLVPIITRFDARRDANGAHRVASIVLTLTLGLAGALAAVAWWFAPELIAWLAPEKSAALRHEATSLTRIMIPAQLFFVCGGVLMAVQFARRRFAIPALAPVIYNLGIIAGGLLYRGDGGMLGFAWGVVVGAFVGSFVLQWWGARAAGFRYRPSVNWRDPEVATYVWLTIPLALGLTMTFSTELFSRYFGGLIGDGGVSCLNFALRLMLVVVALFGQGGGAAAYPFLARLAADGEIAELNRLLARTMRNVLVPVLACSALLFVVADDVTRVVYARGSFGEDALARTAAALRGFLPGAFAWAAASILARAWFACRNTLVPALLSTAGVALALPVFIFAANAYAEVGVAAAASLAMFAQATALFIAWNRRTENAEAGRIIVDWSKALALAAVAAGVAWAAKTIGGLSQNTTWLSSALSIAVATIAFAAAALVLGRVLRLDTFFFVRRAARERPR